MRNPDKFDAFYKDARDRLLLQTYALTGDLTAARAAVRDAFVAASHHWRKLSKLPDPESWARPRAWAHAQRKHTARLWHRDKNIDPETRATLDALGKLTVAQRKTLLLTHLTTLSLTAMAREVGMPRDAAERELQTATSRFTLFRDIDSTSIRPMLEQLRGQLGDPRWPRATIIRRAGATRRRTHTAVGAVGTVAALVVTGFLVTSASGLKPTLGRGDTASTAAASSGGSMTKSAPETLPDSAMLTARQIKLAGRHWRVGQTSTNTAGDGLTLPCQQDRYPDPRGVAALVRTFELPHPAGPAGPAAYQFSEVSASAKAAGRAYDRTLGWYAGCTQPRVQLLSTHQLDRVGDEASMVVLRAWGKPRGTVVAGVARTGDITTTTVTRVPEGQASSLTRAAGLLADAVDDLCHLPDGGSCASRPRDHVVPAIPVGQVPGMLSEVDLPPVRGVIRPWIGTEPRKAITNVAATGCDHTSFNNPAVSNALTRSFLVPGAKVPDEFGLTETVGTMPAARAHEFVQDVRAKIHGCPDKDLGTEVTAIVVRSTKTTDLSVWRVRTEISDNTSVDFLMGIVRDGTAVAQIGFVPSGHVTISADAFPALVRRALERLPALPPPAKG